MVKMSKNKGFSLAEVLTATIIMSMIMVAVVSFIQYGASAWHRGHETISAKNYSRMAMELIKQDLLKATDITEPAIGTTTYSMKYEIDGDLFKLIATSTTNTYIFPPGNNVDYQNDYVLTRITTPSIIATLTMRLARHVRLFQIERLSKRTFQISLQINESKKEKDLDDKNIPVDFEIISSESMVLIAPGLQ